MNGQTEGSNGQILQHKGQGKKVQHRRPRPQEGIAGKKGPILRKTRTSLGGPYEVICHSREGSYYLKSLDGQELPRPWNIEHLQKYY